MTASASGTIDSPGKNVRQKSGLNRSLLDASLGRLVEFIRYKIIRHGGSVEEVYPAYSSQTCSCCGHVDRDSRHGTVFLCTKCGYQDHADVNAAKVIKIVEVRYDAGRTSDDHIETKWFVLGEAVNLDSHASKVRAIALSKLTAEERKVLGILMSTELPMVCTCDREGVLAVEKRRLKIFGRLPIDHQDDLTTAIIISLAFDFQVHADVYADQWFGVSATTPMLEESIFIQCDHPADGLAVIWEHLADKFPERVPTIGMDRSSTLRVADRISTTLFSQYERAENEYRQHRKSAHKGDNDCPPCEDCEVLLTVNVAAYHCVYNQWGCDVLDRAIEKAFNQ